MVGTAEDNKVKVKPRMAPWWSLGFLLILTILYGFRWDLTTAITVWPASLGMIVGLILTSFAKQWRFKIAVAWMAFGYLFVDEVHSFPRMLLPAPPSNLRVVTLNCAGGTPSAAQETIAQKPDIVLLTESPGPIDLAKLAKELYGADGHFLKGPDASIVARGTLVERRPKQIVNNFVAAVWTTPSGRSLNVVAMRLTPPIMRIDLFNPSAWSEFAGNRRVRRLEVESIASDLATMNFKPDLIGGDYNSPPDRGVFSSLTEDLHDSFAVSGVGYGATCVNPAPCIVRIDQIWYSANLESRRTRVVGTENSDHRMLVADFKI